MWHPMFVQCANLSFHRNELKKKNHSGSKRHFPHRIEVDPCKDYGDSFSRGSFQNIFQEEEEEEEQMDSLAISDSESEDRL